jgi:arginyl-tRNA synthetase
MILDLHRTIRARASAALQRMYGLDPAAQPPIVVQYPPTRALGDLALPLAFELARRLRKAPRQIAQELVGALDAIDGVARMEATSQGYVNVFLDRRACLLRWIGAAQNVALERDATTPPDKTIVEHTAINPNKAAHIGHLRNAALGDTLVRLLRFRGTYVEVQNYIDDTGVQVADVVVGFQQLERLDVDAVRRLADTTRFDFYCWDLYARVTEWYEADKERLTHRSRTLHEIEHGLDPAAGMAALIADRIVRRHLETMARMGVDYDLLTWEGDILRLQFWAHAFDILKEAGAVYQQPSGRLAGCWVMRIAEDPAAAEAPAAIDNDDETEQREKVIVRSDGTVTYVGKDIAYQFWKMGLLGRDFYYRPFARRPDNTVLWATTSDQAQHRSDAPRFGGARQTYNVIDTRQSYLQKLLKQALAAMGYAEQAERSTHFSYEMVALSHATARELGYTEVDESRPFIEVSGRKGLGVKADDLLDRLAAKATDEVARRNPEFTPDEQRGIGGTIATAAVRYFLIKYSSGKIIAFDIDEALSFEGESGPYVQYAAVRAANIFQKLRDRDGLTEADVLASLAALPPDTIGATDEGNELWTLVLESARLDEIADQAIRTLEPSVVAKYAFGLAQAFNAFYHRYPILNEERDEVRRWRAATVAFFRLQITRAVDLMGFGVPVRM